MVILGGWVCLMSEAPLYTETLSPASAEAERPYPWFPQAFRVGLNRLLQVLDLYWRSPESCGLW